MYFLLVCLSVGSFVHSGWAVDPWSCFHYQHRRQMSCSQEMKLRTPIFHHQPKPLWKTKLKIKIKNNSPFVMILNPSPPEFSILLWHNPSCFFWVDKPIFWKAFSSILTNKKINQSMKKRFIILPFLDSRINNFLSSELFHMLLQLLNNCYKILWRENLILDMIKNTLSKSLFSIDTIDSSR